ncbi:MAG: hypothetical protein ACLUKN_08040 [Bacilli bacterium]
MRALENSTSQIAKICIPMRGEFEKYGMWINRQFRIQRFESCRGPQGHYKRHIFLLTVLREISRQSFAMPSIMEVRRRMCAEIPLKGCENVGDEGKLIDASILRASISRNRRNALHKGNSRAAAQGGGSKQNRLYFMNTFFLNISNAAVLADAASSAPACSGACEFAVDVLLKVVFSLVCVVVVMSFAGLSVVAERKVCAYIQGRYGPNRTAIPIIAAIPL